jgi:mRNA interferase RelE/StbE
MVATRYEIQILKKPRKVLERLPRDLRERIVRAIDELAEAPRPPGCKKLTGYDNLFRIRVVDWRIAYVVEEDVLTILVLKICP